MPQLRGLDVHVTDGYGKQLQEWGVQHLGLHTPRARVSAYIQSNTNARFQVSVQPRIPYIDANNLLSDAEDSHVIKKEYTGSDDDDYEPKYSGVPPYAFVASLYLDGRKQPERRVVIYTDPGAQDFNQPNGKVWFRHRWMQTQDGSISEHVWVFREKGIELLFDNLVLARAEDRRGGNDDDEIANAFQSSGLNAVQNRSKVGQIQVEVRRVILGRKYCDWHYRSHFKEGRDEGVDMNGVKGEITHATGLVRGSVLTRKPVPVIDFTPYKPEEGVYATFQFFYRSREQLQNFGFPDFQALPKAPRKDSRFLNTRMATLTPLSISRPAVSSKKASEKQESFEEKVRKRQYKKPQTKPGIDNDSRPFLTNPNAQPRSFSFTGGTIKSIAALESGQKQRTSTTADLSSSPPSSNTLTTKNLAKLGAIPANSSQSARISRPNSNSDDQADDELATESDLDTLGDEELPDKPNPAEDDDIHANLRLQLKTIGLGKRSRSAVEEADEEGNIEGSSGLLGSEASADVPGSQESSRLSLLTGEEEAQERGHGSKKAKTRKLS